MNKYCNFIGVFDGDLAHDNFYREYCIVWSID
jgi:hypothetical protein